MRKKSTVLPKTALFFLVLFLLAAPTAAAGWVATGTGQGAAKALVMPQGAKPTAAATGTNITVTWSAVTVGGASVTYTVQRFDGVTGAPASIGAGCAGTLSGTSCTETNVPAGTWRYSVTPVRHNWIGSESPRSDSVVVAAPLVVAAPTSVALANGGGQGNAYINIANRTSVQVAVGLGATSKATDTVTVRMTDRTGASLTRTAAATEGAGTVTVGPFDTSSLADGQVTLAASARAQTGETSSETTASVTRDTVAPSGADIQAVNKTGGIAGRAELADTVTYTFSEPMNPASFIAGWSGLATDVVFRINNTNPDTFLVLSTALAQLPFGSSNLASSGYVSARVDFTASSAAMSGSTITLTLGATVSTAVGTVTSATTMTWTPASGPTDLAGNPLSTAAVTEKGAADVEF